METFRIRKLTLIIEIEKNNYNLSYKQLIKDFVYKKLENIIAKTIANCDFNIEGILYIENEIILNLNPIKIENDHNIVYKNIQNSLKEEFQKKIQNIINIQSHEIIPLQIYKKNIFIDYLKTGIWNNNYVGGNINETYYDILNSSEENVKDIFLSINDNISAICLFFKKINEELINRTIKILYKKNYQKIQNIIDDFIKIKKIICNDFYPEEIIKKKTKELLLSRYGQKNFDQNIFIIDFIKEINNSNKEKYEKTIYETHHKIQNINKINRYIFKSNLIKTTIENLYIKNFENIEKQPFYNIDNELKTLDIAIKETKINNSKKKIQKLIEEIDSFFSLQYFNKEKIKVILNNKIRNINFQDCDISALINIFCPHLLTSYSLFQEIFHTKNQKNNILTVEFFNKKENSITTYINSNVENLCKNNNNISFFEKIKKNILQKKKENNSQEIEILHNKFIQIYFSKKTFISTNKDVFTPLQTIGIATIGTKLLLPTETKQQPVKTYQKHEKTIAIEDKKEEKEIQIKRKNENIKKIETKKDSNKEKSNKQIPILQQNRIKTIVKKENNYTKDTQNNFKTEKIEKELNKDIGKETTKKELKKSENSDKKNIIQAIFSLILKKKTIKKEQKDSLDIEQKKEIIARIVKSEKEIISDLINIFSQVSFLKNKNKSIITDFFFDSFKYKFELDFSILYIINNIVLKGTIPKEQLFLEIKNIIKNDNSQAAYLFKKTTNEKQIIFNNSQKNNLHELLLISEYNDVYKKNNIFDKQNINILNKYLIDKFNHLIKDLNIELIKKEIPIVNNIQLKKEIINVFVKNYIKKIKNQFSKTMSILYLEKFNYIDEFYIEKLISFLEQIIESNTSNKKIDNFLSYCKNELTTTLSKHEIISKINKQQLKKIFILLPEISENINKIEIQKNKNVQQKQDDFKRIITAIKNKDVLIFEKLNNFTSQELFSFLEYSYFKLFQKKLLEDIFLNKETQKKYNSTILIFNKLLQNQNINSKKIKIIIDYLFIKNHNKKNNIYIYNDIIKIIDLTNIIYGINLTQYFFKFQSKIPTFYKNINLNNFNKIINLYINKFATLLKNKNNYGQNIKEIQQIEFFLKKNSSYNHKKNTEIEQIEKKTEEKKILCEEKVDEICREKNIKKIYIRNGGLVIMWPFFYDFFKKQNLLDEYNKTIFKNNISKSNAIHALEFLVNESYKNPDWKLILNKILCGVDIKENIFNEYVFNEKAINEEEDDKQTIKQEKEIEFLKNNTTNTIKECIDKWKDLNSLIKFDEFKNGINVKMFRNYFLQREGFLNIIEQKYDNGVRYNYILDISNKCYDEYIKGIPWDMQKIELPNMQQPIFIRNFGILHENKKK